VFGIGEGWCGEGKLGLPLFHELYLRLHEEPGFCCKCKGVLGQVVSPLFGEFVDPLVAPNIAVRWAPGDGDLPAEGA